MSFTFGSPIVGTATPQQQQPTMFGVGGPLASSTPAQGNFGMGAPATSQAPSLFGTTPGAAPAGGSTGFNFASTGFGTGTTTTSQASSLFGTGTTAVGAQGQGQQPSLFGTMTTSTAAPQQQTSLFGSTNPTAGGVSSGFSFSNPATSQPQAGGFSLGGVGGGGGGIGMPTMGGGGTTGFSFGGGAPAQGQGGQLPQIASFSQQAAVPSFQGLGGIPGNPTPRISTLALGGDPGTGWSTRNDNRNVQEMPVPPEIIAIVEEMKNQMKNHKQAMMQVTRTFDTVDIDVVAEQIEEVRLSVITLSNLMHKQELQSASLIKDMQELSKEMDLLSQARDVPGYGSTNLLYNFLFELVSKYGQRMAKYKVEIERAEFSLETSVGASFTNNINAKDLWDSLAAIKDTVILLAAQVQQLQEDLRKELLVHKNLTQVVFGQQPNKWLNNALSSSNAGGGIGGPGGGGGDQNVPPLERMLSTPSKHGQAQGQGQGVGQANSLETIYQRTYSMFNRGTSTTDSRAQMSDVMRTPSQAANLGGGGGGGTGFGSPSFHPSMMGSYLGPSGSPSGGNASLKRSKK